MKKIAGVCLCFVFVLSLLTGCKKDDASNPASVASTDSSYSISNMGSSADVSVASTAGASVSASSSSGSTAYTPNHAFDWAAILVNKTHPLPKSYTFTPGNIDTSHQFDTRALPYMKQMLAAAKADGINLNVISSYRSVALQTQLFNNKVSEFINSGDTSSAAQSDAAMLVAPPGTSEHNSGLAADIVSTDWYSTHSSLTADFDQTKEGKWLFANAANYGFILRYPEDKVSITQISYEPWHYRFVGPTAAKYIMANHLTLEEYDAQYYPNYTQTSSTNP